MAESKNPFYIINNFISPLYCEKIIEDLTFHTDAFVEQYLNPQLKLLIPELEKYFTLNISNILPLNFLNYSYVLDDYYKCDSHKYENNKWIRLNSIALTGIIFLSQYNNTELFDPDFDVFGGEFDFYSYKIKFKPNRGTLIIYPDCPTFVNKILEIRSGKLNFIKFNIISKKLYNYNSNNFSIK